MHSHAVVLSHESYPLELTVSAWLDSKSKLSGSARTHRNYVDVITAFRAALQRADMDLDSPTPDVRLMAQAWASKSFDGLSNVSAATYNQRLAVLSSFYTFARNRQLLDVSNPIELVGRRKLQSYGSATPLSASIVGKALRSVNRSALAGKRDYALLAVAFTTGRRLAELAAMRVADVQVEDGHVAVLWPRAKGAKVMRDAVSQSVGKALLDYLHALYGDALDTILPVWVSLAHDGTYGKRLSERSFANICLKHLGTSKVRALRHTFAHSMAEAGAKVSYAVASHRCRMPRPTRLARIVADAAIKLQQYVATGYQTFKLDWAKPRLRRLAAT